MYKMCSINLYRVVLTRYFSIKIVILIEGLIRLYVDFTISEPIKIITTNEGLIVPKLLNLI